MKLEFNNDFTNFLENNEFNDSVQIVTESEIIKCSAVLLAQHSSVLREYIKQDNEIFLTDNKHVRECLIVLYGGSISLTEENFQDILKFMVAFDIPEVRKQVLDWMSEHRWNLDNVGLLINGSMVVTIGGNPLEWKCSKEEIYQPCRLFFGEHLPKTIVPDSTDERYRDLDSAMDHVISRVVDKTELLYILLHQDLIPEYIPWFNMLMDQSNYKILLDSFEKPEISIAMSLCPRTQFDELFGKMEDFDNITMKEYKHLNRYKLKINDKITVLQSLKFMKECGSFYSCWKILDLDGMFVLSTAFTDKSDQFCVIECLFSWLVANKSSCDMDIVQKFLSKAIHHWSRHPDNKNAREYCCHSLQNAMDMLQIPQDRQLRWQYNHDTIGNIKMDQSSFNTCFISATFQEEIFLQLSAPFNISVTLYQDRIPKVSCDESFENYHLYVYAWNVEELHGRVHKTTKLPLYSDPDIAYKTLKTFKCWQRSLGLSKVWEGSSNYIRFSIICVGV